jgi:DNA-binding transcriptional LysR family regulator
MDTNALKIFYAVAEEGSVSKAAGRLNCVQSNVTTRLRQLEDELGAKLLYRKKRGMELTPDGLTLLDYTRRVLKLMQEAEQAVRESDQIKGPLSIGSLDSTAAVRLPKAVSRFIQEYPEVDFSVKTGSTDALLQMVLDYKLDGAFLIGPVEHAELRQEPMFIEELVALTAPHIKDPSQIKNPTLMVFSKGCKYRAALETWSHRSNLAPFKIMEFGTHEGILGCVEGGLGITLFPLSLIKRLNYVNKLTIHTLPEEQRNIAIVFIRRKDSVTTKALEAFLNMIREENKSAT